MFLKTIGNDCFEEWNSAELADFLYENDVFESADDALENDRKVLVDLAVEVWEEKGRPEYIYQEVLNSNEAYSLLDNALYPDPGTWNQGGCLILANAFADLFKDSGSVISMMDKSTQKPTHYGFKFNNGAVVDFDGLHSNENDWVNSFCENESLNNINYIATHFIENSEVKCNIEASFNISIMLKNTLDYL